MEGCQANKYQQRFVQVGGSKLLTRSKNLHNKIEKKGSTSFADSDCTKKRKEKRREHVYHQLY